MSEIEVGEYVRTKKGKIDKVCAVLKDEGIVRCEKNRYWLEDIKKHKEKLTDLIEVGDYVNEKLVLQIDYKNKNICLLIPLADTKSNTNIMWYGYEDIKSIVTKEQFKNIEYKVGD